MPRIAAPLNIINKPGVGMSYIAIDLDASKQNGKPCYVHVSTTCRRDVDPAKGGNPALAPLTGYSDKDEPFFKAKIGKKPLFSYIKFLCGSHHEKCVSECGRYEWTGVPLKEAPSDWEVTHAKDIHAERKSKEAPAKVEEKTEEKVAVAAAKKSAPKKSKKVKKVKTEVKKETPKVKVKAKKKTFYNVQDGKVITKRVVNQPEGWFASRQEAEATISA